MESIKKQKFGLWKLEEFYTFSFVTFTFEPSFNFLKYFMIHLDKIIFSLINNWVVDLIPKEIV